MQQRGFTFVEMMIAVGVIGILTALRQALAEYYLMWNNWPTVTSVGGFVH